MTLEQRRILLGFAWGVAIGSIVTHFAEKKKMQAEANRQIDEALEFEEFKRNERLKKDTDVLVQGSSGEQAEANISDALAIIKDAKYISDNEPPKVYGRRDPGELEQVESIERALAMGASIDELDTTVYIEPEDVLPTVHFEEPDDMRDPAVRQFDDTIRPNNADDVPYIISVDEFMDDNGYDKLTVTYYDGTESQTLADDHDAVITKITPLLGDEFLTRFGERSGDKSIVYVRNERFLADIEVTLNENSYEEVVLGMRPYVSRGLKFAEDD